VTKHLIVNADDYGRAPGLSAGVRAAHQRGIVTSTTAMMTYPYAPAEIELARQTCPALALGVHLCITGGRPVAPPQAMPSLVKPDGSFYAVGDLPAVVPKMDPAELCVELRAQIERFLESGASLDHLDSHHHVTYLCLPFFQVMLDLAREYGVPVRYPMGDDPASVAARLSISDDEAERLVAESRGNVPTPDRFLDTFYDETATLESLLATLDALHEGVSELMCHPGYVDEALDGDYFAPREREVSILTHPAARARIDERGIKLATFKVLGQKAFIQR
jgi:predicted glycoside hydrolase/deacetylase ChbG (UPF0249 family)